MEQLGLSNNNVIVIDRFRSHLRSDLKVYVREALKKINISQELFQEHTIAFERSIGYSNVVRVENNDKVFYAKRTGRKGYSKFVKNKPFTNSNYFTLVLLKSKKITNEYILVTAYIGKRVGPEPYDMKCTKEDLMQWKELAFVSELVEYDEGTVTTIPPKYWQY